MPWGAAIGAAAAIGSAVISSSAQKSAAKSQSQGTGTATGDQLQMYNQSRADLAPYRNSGNAANNQLSYLLGLQPPTGTGSNANMGMGTPSSSGSGGTGAIANLDPSIVSSLESFTSKSPNLQYPDGSDAFANHEVGLLATMTPTEYAQEAASLGITAPQSTFISAQNGGQPLTRDQIYQQMLPNYTTAGTAASQNPFPLNTYEHSVWDSNNPNGGTAGTSGSIDYTGLNKAVDDAFSQQQTAQTTAANVPSNNGYGSTVNTGLGAYGSLSSPFDLTKFQADPGYNFRLQQGNQALNQAQAARGNFYSGSALKEADAYNSDQAAQQYQQAYTNYNTDQNNLYSKLAGVSNQGMGATNAGVALNTGAGNALAGIATAAGQNAANASVAGGNIYSQGLSGLLGGGGSSFGNSLSGLFGSSGSSGLNYSMPNSGYSSIGDTTDYSGLYG